MTTSALITIEITSLLGFWLFCYLRYKRTVRIQLKKTEECRIKHENNNIMNDTLTLNDIKKALYRTKPKAMKTSRTPTDTTYQCSIKIEDKKVVYEATFTIPNHEAEGFDALMDAQLLIRWLD